MKIKKPGIISVECYASAEKVYDDLCEQVKKALRKQGFKNLEDGESVTGSRRAKVGESVKSTIKIPISFTVYAEVEYEEDDE